MSSGVKVAFEDFIELFKDGTPTVESVLASDLFLGYVGFLLFPLVFALLAMIYSCVL